MIAKGQFLASVAIGFGVSAAAAWFVFPPDGSRLSFSPPEFSESSASSEGANNPSIGGDTGNENLPAQAMSPEEELQELLSFIDELSHPDDPTRPAGISGASDADIATMPPEHVALLLEESDTVAADDPSGRRLFNLGRVADIHGYVEEADRLFGLAASRGSGTAKAYIADKLLEQNEFAQALPLLQQSVQSGFAPAQPLLNAVQAAVNAERRAAANASPRTLDYSKFNRPDIIRAFHTGDVSGLNRNLLESITYASTLHNTWTDTQVLFLVNDTRIRLEIDPTVGHKAASKLLGSRQGMNEAMNTGLQSLFAPLMAMAQTRQAGGSVMDEVQASNQAILNSPMVKLDVLRQQAAQDAERLAILYDSDPETFRKVYAGLRKFVGR